MEEKKSMSTLEDMKQKGVKLLEALRACSPTRPRSHQPVTGGASMSSSDCIDANHCFISPRVREMKDVLRSASHESQKLLERGSSRKPSGHASAVGPVGQVPEQKVGGGERAKSVAEDSIGQGDIMPGDHYAEASKPPQQQMKTKDGPKDLQHDSGSFNVGDVRREKHQASHVAGRGAGQGPGELSKALSFSTLVERQPQAEAASSSKEACLLSALELDRDGAGIVEEEDVSSPVGSLTSDGGFYCAPRPRLILHVDINKTILIRDQAQDAGSDSMVNVLLSECAWGRYLPGPKWIPVGRLATDKPAADPDLMTYRHYLDGFLLPFERGFSKEVDKMNDEIKVKRQVLKRNFTSPGEPGEMFRGVYMQLMAALQVPEEKAEEMRRAKVGDGKEIVVLPSFFELLKHLQLRNREFAIVFRTFGTDAIEIIHEINLFCTGQHPLYPGVRMDGSDGKTDLRLQLPESSGCFYRHKLDSSGTLLAVDVPENIMSARVIKPHLLEPVGNNVQLYNNFQEIYGFLNQRCMKGRNVALALRDYYPWWKSHQERAKTGKLMVVEREDYSIHQIFLDDNVGFGNAHIVDVRDLDTGDPVPFSESIGKYIVKVEPLNAILDSQYFIRTVRRCEEERNAKHYDAISRSQSQPLLVKPSKWRRARIGVFSVIRLAANR